MKIVVVKVGDSWCCYDEYNFINSQESPIEFGNTPQEAVDRFCNLIGMY